MKSLICNCKCQILLIALTFIILSSKGVLGQIIIKGKVLDSNGSPIDYASIVAKNSTSIISHTFTDSLGSFKFNLPRDIDTIKLEINHIDYRSFSKYYSLEEFPLDIYLENESNKLDEIIIKAAPFEKNGDTISFNIFSYIKKEDNTLEDVLKRLPGIQINNNGTIFYKGLDISKFYIEGLDMLGGKYAIATKNLPLSSISRVQVFERHQEIKALEDIFKPENAAINVELKSGIVSTAKASIGIGAYPFLYNSKINYFAFQKKLQFNVNLHANNAGLNYSNEFENKITIYSLPTNFLSVNSISLPFNDLKDKMLFNREKGVQINLLKKINGHSQLTFQLGYIDDKLTQNNTRNQSFFNNNNLTYINEKVSSIIKPRKLSSKLAFTSNSSKNYFVSNFFIDLQKDSSIANSNINEEKISEFLDYYNRNLKSQNTFLFKKNKKAYKFYADFKHSNTHENLIILGYNQQKLDDVLGFLNVDVSQLVRLKKNDLYIHSNTYNKKNNLSYGSHYGLDAINTNLISRFDSKDIVDSFLNKKQANSNRINRAKIFFDPNLEYNYKKIKIVSTLKNSLNQINRTSVNNSYDYELHYTYNIELLTSIQSDEINYGLRINNSKLIRDNTFYENPIIRSFYNTNQIVANTEINKGNYITSFFNYTNPVKNNSISFSASYNLINSNLIETNNIIDKTISSFISKGESKSESYDLNFFFKTYVFNKLSVSGNGKFSTENRGILLNNRFLESDFTSMESSIKLSYTFTNFTLSYDVNWIGYDNDFSKPTNNLTNSINGFFQLHKNAKLYLKYDNYKILAEDQSFQTNLLSAKLLIKQKDNEISLTLNNLFNEKKLNLFYKSTIQEVITKYQLRPLQINLNYTFTL